MNMPMLYIIIFTAVKCLDENMIECGYSLKALYLRVVQTSTHNVDFRAKTRNIK